MPKTTIRENPHGELLIERFQDVSPILENNKILANSGDGYSASREWRRAASIPLIIVEKWKTEEGIDVLNPDHQEAVRRKLNSSEYAFLRTAPGRL
jgi:hypothetical protein